MQVTDWGTKAKYELLGMNGSDLESIVGSSVCTTSQACANLARLSGFECRHADIYLVMW
jgi:hypothetical protein